MDRCLGSEEGDGEAGGRVEPREAFLFLCRRALQIDPAETPQGYNEREDALYTILYHYCQRCRAAHLPTADGPIEIAPEVVERVEGEAARVTIRPEEVAVLGQAAELAGCSCGGDCAPGNGQAAIPHEHASTAPGSCPDAGIDPPNTLLLTRKVLLRSGCVCSNPFCRRKLNLQAHHVVFRSRGGRTALSNELAVCPLCHALIHAFLLTVRLGPDCEPMWSRKVDALPGPADIARELAALGSIPEVRVVESGRVDSPVRTGAGLLPESGRVDSPAVAQADLRVESGRVDSPAGRYEAARVGGGESETSVAARERDADLVQALRSLGFSAAAARQRLARAWEFCRDQGGDPSDEDLLKAALRQRGR